MRKDGTYMDKRAKKIVEEVETRVLSQLSSNNTEDGCHQESNSQAPTILMKDQAFYSVKNSLLVSFAHYVYLYNAYIACLLS